MMTMMTGQWGAMSPWSFMTGWLTPTNLIVFVNILIGTIVITSRFTSNKRPRHQYDQVDPRDSPGQLARAPSLLDRVKSINFYQYKFPSPSQEVVQEPNFFQQHTDDTNPIQPPQPQPQLARTPSLLDRVKSINVSLYKFPSYSREQEQEQQHFVQHTEPSYDANPVEPDQPPLARSPSFLERVWSGNFSSVYRSQQDTEAEVINNPETEANREHKPKRSQSETKKSKRKVQESMKKSVSEKSMRVGKEEEEEEEAEMIERRRPQTTRLERTVTISDEDHGVDAKADDFINKFKKQLRLQRLDSLLRYKEMLQG